MGLTPAAVNELKATNILNMRAGLVTTTDTFIDDGFTTSTTDLSIASDDLGKARDTLERFQNELQSVNVTEYDHYDLSEHEKDFTKSFKNILSDIEDNEKDSSGDRLPDKSQPIFSETEKSSFRENPLESNEPVTALSTVAGDHTENSQTRARSRDKYENHPSDILSLSSGKNLDFKEKIKSQVQEEENILVDERKELKVSSSLPVNLTQTSFSIQRFSFSEKHLVDVTEQSNVADNLQTKTAPLDDDEAHQVLKDSQGNFESLKSVSGADEKQIEYEMRRDRNDLSYHPDCSSSPCEVSHSNDKNVFPSENQIEKNTNKISVEGFASHDTEFSLSEEESSLDPLTATEALPSRAWTSKNKQTAINTLTTNKQTNRW